MRHAVGDLKFHRPSRWSRTDWERIHKISKLLKTWRRATLEPAIVNRRIRSALCLWYSLYQYIILAIGKLRYPARTCSTFAKHSESEIIQSAIFTNRKIVSLWRLIFTFFDWFCLRDILSAGLAASLGYGAATEMIRRTGSGKDDSSSIMMSETNIKRLVSKLVQMRGAALKLGQFMSIQGKPFILPLKLLVL